MRMLMLLSIFLFLAGSTYSQELPEQFRIWGKVAREHSYLAPPEPIPMDGFEYTPEEEKRGFTVFSILPSAVITSSPDHNYAWPSQDASRSKMPTLRWEAVR